MVDQEQAPSSVGAAHVADSARSALARHAWREAYDLLSKADAGGSLTPPELDLLAQAAWWIGRLPEAIEVRERAFGAASTSGDVPSAVMLAINLARDNLLRNDVTVANAWLRRAERLLDGVPEHAGHGYLAACRSFASALAGDPDKALADAGTAIDAMIAVQRRLADHRDRQGFAPAVRIGLHTAEASRTGLDYLGGGVNHAARIGDAAQGGEILASNATIADAGRAHPASGQRTLRLKGITGPVAVTAIDWR